MYDNNNIFAKIARGEIPTQTIVENEYALSFRDINPLFSTHVLIIPRGEYTDILDFAAHATPAEQAGFWDCFVKTAEKLGIAANFNVLANAGADAPFVAQSVFHFHMHLMAGPRTAAFEQEMACICQK